MNAQTLAALLAGVPEKRLRIIRLANELCGESGMDYDAAMQRRPEVEAAIEEASEYVKHTHTLTSSLGRYWSDLFG